MNDNLFSFYRTIQSTPMITASIPAEFGEGIISRISTPKEMMEGSDFMSSFEIDDCSVTGTITGGGNYVDAVVGDPACAVSVNCEGGMTVVTEESEAAA